MTDPIPPGERRILHIILDDVGRAIHALAPTPGLDSIRNAGVEFTRACLGARCTPTRASFLSGLYPFRPDHLLGRTLGKNVAHELRATGMLLADRAPGTAALAGKYHVGRAPLHPLAAGFREWRGVQGNLNVAEPIPGQSGTYEWWMEHFAGPQGGGSTMRGPGRYITSLTAHDAAAYVDAGHDLVVASLNAIHTPLHVPPPLLHSQGFPTSDLGKAVAMLEAADTEIGGLLDVARLNGYTILAWADNGSSPKIGGGKGTYYDSSVRTWLYAEGPGISPGVCGALIQATDLYRTTLDLLGAPVTPHDATTDSVSFAPLIFDPDAPAGRESVYIEGFQHNGTPPTADVWDRHVRTLEWSYILNRTKAVPPLPLEELYDLVADPGEETNLAGDPSHADTLARMRGMLP